MKTLRLHIIAIEPSQYMFNHHKYISRMNAIVAKRWIWRNKETLELDCFFAKIRASRQIECISPPNSRVSF